MSVHIHVVCVCKHACVEAAACHQIQSGLLTPLSDHYTLEIVMSGT